MILKYGSYAHASNEVWIAIVRETWRNDRGARRGYIETWTISGRLLASGADLIADLTTKIAALKVGYADDGANLILYEDDGITATDHQLLTADAVGGVKVDGPSFPTGQGAEYATYRDYTITAKAQVEDETTELLAFVETVSVQGTGGKRFVVQQPLRGFPIKQGVADRTPVMIVQDGMAVGRTAYPVPPGPIIGASEHVDRRTITRKNPKVDGDGSLREFEISWHYEMEHVKSAATVSPHAGL